MPALEPPSRPNSPPPSGGWLGLLLAAAAGVVIFTALAFLTGGFLALVLVIAGGMFAFAALHYLVWGWWLSKILYDEEAADNARQEEAKQRDELERHSDAPEDESQHDERIDRDPHGQGANEK